VARLYDMQPKHTRINGYYPGGAPAAKATEDIYTTLMTNHRLKLGRLTEHARMTQPEGHVTLIEFDCYLWLSFRDQTNAPRAYYMKISEFGYEEVPAAEYEKAKAAAGHDLFDLYSKTQDDYVALLRQALANRTYLTDYD
jgi:hypothetical protein